MKFCSFFRTFWPYVVLPFVAFFDRLSFDPMLVNQIYSPEKVKGVMTWNLTVHHNIYFQIIRANLKYSLMNFKPSWFREVLST